jgi:hypothetical protein
MIVKTRIICILVIIVFCDNVSAQRHYEGASGLDASAGSRISGGNFDAYFNASYSEYLSKSSYYKIGINYLASTFDVSSESVVCMNYFVDGKYFYTLFSNKKSVFLNLGGGAFLGYEKIPSLERYAERGIIVKDYTSGVMAGISMGVEVEWLFYKNFGFIIGFSEMYSALSPIDKWQSTCSFGIKYLFN